jgi:tRNA (guanine-N7-)-methyltransferase
LKHSVFAPDFRPLSPDAWKEIFGRSAPVCVEVGPGLGEFLVAMATHHPEQDFFAVEHVKSRVVHIQAELRRRALNNARALHADANFALALLPPASVDSVFVQFPDPWWKRRHHRRRLLTPPFVAKIRRALRPGGTVELITDVAEYFERARPLLDADPGLELVTTDLSLVTATSFSRKAMRRGAQLHACLHRRVACDQALGSHGVGDDAAPCGESSRR